MIPMTGDAFMWEKGIETRFPAASKSEKTKVGDGRLSETNGSGRCQKDLQGLQIALVVSDAVFAGAERVFVVLAERSGEAALA